MSDHEIQVRLLGPQDGECLDRVAPGVFDNVIDSLRSAEFMGDGRHHLVVALDDGVVVGMASAVHYVHPDKEPQLFINEVGVAPTHYRRGIARRMLDRLMRLAADLDCTEAWVLTDRTNIAAQRLYEAAGAITPAEDCVMYTIPVEPIWTP
jgi:ribosomal protein S18 acetylase RimI-like enzyme